MRTALSATTAAALAAALGVSGAHASAAKAPAPPVADLACRVFVEQDNYSSPLNRHGNRTSTNEIKGVTVGCSSPNGAFASGNRARNPVLLSSSYTSTGGPAVNRVTMLNRDCTTITQIARLRFTWNTGDVSVGQITIDANGNTASKVLSGLMAGDTFTFSGPALPRTDSYVTYLGSCSTANPGGEADGFIFNAWLPGGTGSAGNEIGLTFTRP
ncbi:hypothetical protein [Peterkaempfera griseoplana]|uniref:hypothetical protein n=1 Tax=Peterkaempfera griseoplana TaxID=66896 RepID=UPI0006E18B31|nr:hypothetical protein [Peterkaempfera griseoplana]